MQCGASSAAANWLLSNYLVLTWSCIFGWNKHLVVEVEATDVLITRMCMTAKLAAFPTYSSGRKTHKTRQSGGGAAGPGRHRCQFALGEGQPFRHAHAPLTDPLSAAPPALCTACAVHPLINTRGGPTASMLRPPDPCSSVPPACSTALPAHGLRRTLRHASTL